MQHHDGFVGRKKWRKTDETLIKENCLTSPLPDGWTDRPQEMIGQLL